MINKPQNDEAKQAVINDLLKELPTDTAVEVELPSECRAYTLEDDGAPVTVRPMTFEDEKALVSAKKGDDPVNLVLQRCTTNLKIPDLLSMDKLFLIMKLREISYGDDYSTLLICSHCSAENPTTVKLSHLNVNPVPDDFKDPMEVTLPTINKKAKVRLPRVRDERMLADPAEALEQVWRFVSEIEGHTDKSIIAPVIDQLPLKDIRTILNAIKTDYGVDTKIKFECTNCGGVTVVDLPIDANFFDVN
jgi:rRNA maturation protein Nop10